MINLDLDWEQAAGAAAGLSVATVVLRARHKPMLTRIATATLESGLILGLFALWQYAGSFSVVSPAGAVGRSRWIWRLERDLRLPSETSVQHLFLPHPLVIQFFNLYYDSLHFPVLIACMIWLFAWHRDRYGRWRTTLVAFTGLCLLVQFIPVAPPRMLPGTGLVDTAVLYHQSVYSSVAGFDPDQLSAMPSVHVGWALLIATAVITTATSRWRWLAAVYPVMTTLAVIITANHFWLDGVVAAAILVLVLGAQALSRRLLRGRSRPQSRTGLAADKASLVLAGRRDADARELADGRAVVDDDAQRLGEHRRHDCQLR
ncbi:MAG: phosphatase PAP2 family protein [Streptosporangiaceae bacterium]